MYDDLDQSLLLVVLILLGLGLLMYVLTVIDPKTQRRPASQTSRRAMEDRR